VLSRRSRRLQRAVATTLAATWPAYWADCAVPSVDGRDAAERACELLSTSLAAMAELDEPEAVLAYTALAELGDGLALRALAGHLRMAAPWSAPDRGAIARELLPEDVLRWCRAHSGDLELQAEDRVGPGEASLRAPVVSLSEFGAMVASSFRDACGAYRAFVAERGQRRPLADGTDGAAGERAAAAHLLADCRSLTQIHRVHGLAYELGTGTEALALALAVARSWLVATWHADGVHRGGYVFTADLVAELADDPELGAWLERVSLDPAALQGAP
jgi:hypothetical protein